MDELPIHHERRKPIDMVLFCPCCVTQHIDAADWCPVPSKTEFAPLKWTNPPHRSHLCSYCGHVWRPADVPTNGVLFVQTKGKNDSPIVKRNEGARWSRDVYVGHHD